MPKSHGNKNAMKSVVVAVEPLTFSDRSHNFNLFFNTIKKFQTHRLLPSIKIISIIHPSLYMIPNQWYFKNENRYANEAKNHIKNHIKQNCEGKFNFQSIQILKGKSSNNQLLAEQLFSYLKRIQSPLLVILSRNRHSISSVLLGSFTETTALVASTPTLVIKHHTRSLIFANKPRLLVALDSTVNYSARQLKWIENLALISKANIDIISVKPNQQNIFLSLRNPKKSGLPNKALQKWKKTLVSKNIPVTLNFVKEKESIAQTVVNFADKKKSWVIITVLVERKFMRRLLLGSTARRILTLTKRSFLALQ